MGARPLARVIQEKIKTPLAEEVLFGKLSKGGTVRILIKGDALDFQYLGPDEEKALPKPDERKSLPRTKAAAKPKVPRKPRAAGKAEPRKRKPKAKAD
jgi:ATP-dependent Clp protease ATP-binding subunit ClpA